MHGMNGHRDLSRSRRRRALEVLAVLAGGYGAYQLVRQLRARQQPADRTSLPCARTLPRTSMVASTSKVAPASKVPSAYGVMSPAASPSLGEHSAWLETFRAEQVQRLRSDPPAA